MAARRLLFITRHAKSSWKDVRLGDSQRPLNKRGKRDAPVMGERVASQPERPGLIVSSPAARALKTAHVIARRLGIETDDVRIDERIYGADAAELVKIIQLFDDRHRRVMLVGHNPALTDLLNLLTDAGIEYMPTCSIATVAFHGAGWRAVRAGEGMLVAFDYPKK